MPPVELKSKRNRKRTGRSRLHLSSTPQPSCSTASPPNTASTSPQPLNTTHLKESSSSDERHEESPSASSISSSSPFDDEHWRRSIRKRDNGLNDTVWWGWFLLSTTWIVFVLGMGGVCGVWEWGLKPIRLHTRNKFVPFPASVVFRGGCQLTV
jgi:hypothetical protein